MKEQCYSWKHMWVEVHGAPTQSINTSNTKRVYLVVKNNPICMCPGMQVAPLTEAKKEVVVVCVLDQVAPSPSVASAGVLFVSLVLRISGYLD